MRHVRQDTVTCAGCGYVLRMDIGTWADSLAVMTQSGVRYGWVKDGTHRMCPPCAFDQALSASCTRQFGCAVLGDMFGHDKAGHTARNLMLRDFSLTDGTEPFLEWFLLFTEDDFGDLRGMGKVILRRLLLVQEKTLEEERMS